MSSEVNKEAAGQWRDLGRTSFKQGQFEEAARRLSKSQRLYPNPETEDLLAKVHAAISRKSESWNGRETPSSSFGRSPASPSVGASAADGGLRNRRAGGISAEQDGAATAEQITLVKRVLRCSTNFYEVLEVSKSCSEDDVKKAYRKLSLKVHPDKNKAPGSEDAFKIVSRAFKCLSDSRLRANYDAYGNEDPNQARLQRHREQRQHSAGHPFFQEEFDPDDVFNAFFGMHSANGRVFMNRGFPRQRRQAQRREGDDDSSDGVNLGGLLRALPFILLLFYFLMPAAEPVYKLNTSPPYTTEIHTARWGVPFYVKSGEKFVKSYPTGSYGRWRIDQAVESEYKESLEVYCYQERLQRSQFYRWGKQQEAKTMSMPHCEQLQRILQVE